MKLKRKWIILISLILLCAVLFLTYTESYYHADEQAVAALASDEQVQVTMTDYGWYFDGPSAENALVFYPGGKVEETAYAPFLHQLAREGMDVCLVKMPFRLAFLGADKAAYVMEQYSYPHWYIGGHSLEGAFAAIYAADHGEQLDGVILCAAYPTKELDQHLTELSLYGSEDRVLDKSKVEENRKFAPGHFVEYTIQGGNHAYFGNYGEQKGDGFASISAKDQQEEAVKAVMGVCSITDSRESQ
jgi:hypothetical protein